MKVLLIGYGKMGHFLGKTLLEDPRVTELYIYDTVFRKSTVAERAHYLAGLSDDVLKSVDCAFIATPVSTHCDILKMLINSGVRKLYVEKPAVVNDREYKEINAIRNGCMIVTGYILRQSESMQSLKRIMGEMEEDGFSIEKCSVVYQKYLPASLEERAKTDMGVFEEIVHVWDLLFNYLNFRSYERKTVFKEFRDDPELQGRIISARIGYDLDMQGKPVRVELNSSFMAATKKREFKFLFKNETGERKTVTLSFDDADYRDRVRVTDCENNIIHFEEYPSLLKLCRQTENVFSYFETGKTDNLSLFEDSKTIIDLFEMADLSR